MNRSISLFFLSALVLGSLANPAAAYPTSSAETVCPTQILPIMPSSAMLQGRHDVVHIRALVRAGTVHDVEIVSGPRIYASAIRKAMAEYQCQTEPAEMRIAQEFDFDAADTDH